ncbi:MAG: FAD-dependent oxidoreductase [Planctomycetes bacterium]|nr:FAD-dependent oxidoreductase [Planctomycetota bacterium]
MVVGGGFGGAYAARRLDRTLGLRPDVEVVLLNDQNYLLFTPMLHEVAAGDLHAPDITVPLRQMLRRVRFVEGEATAIDLEKRMIRCLVGPARRPQRLWFDHLLLAPGSVANFFGMQGVATSASTMRTVADAALLHNRMVALLEDAAAEPNEEIRRRLMTFVVAGGGFAGVETIGAINGFLRDAVRRYRELDPSMLRLVLVHPGHVVLPELGERLGVFAEDHLRRRGVELRLRTRVTGYDHWVVSLSHGEPIAANTLVWTAGARPAPAVDALPVEKVGGRLRVNERLELVGYEGVVWAVGDSAAVPDGRGGLHPPTAQHAIRQGWAAARNIEAAVDGKPGRPLSFSTVGQLASLGHFTGVAQILGVRFTGFVAWWLWRSVYLMKLPGVVRKLRVAIQWTLDLIFPRQLEQLITRRELEQVQRLAATVEPDAHPGPARPGQEPVAGGGLAAARPQVQRHGPPAPTAASVTSAELVLRPLLAAGWRAEQSLDVALLTAAAVEELRQGTGALHASGWLVARGATERVEVAERGAVAPDRHTRAVRAAEAPPVQGFASSGDASLHVLESGGRCDVLVRLGGEGGIGCEILLGDGRPLLAGDGVHIAGVVQPVLTALRKQRWLERLERRWLEASARLEAEVHDLRSPLTSLRLGIHAMHDRARSLGDPESTQLGDALAATIERVVGAVASLTCDRLSAEARMQCADPFEIVRAQVREIGGQARARSIDLQVRFPVAPIAAALDPAWFRRAVQNLLDNALEHSPAGSTVTVSSEITATDVVLHVDDEGPGFPAAALEGLPLPGGGIAGPAAGGPKTGIGLWSAREAMRAMGGRLRIGRNDRRGARVSLSLPKASQPVVQTDDPAAAAHGS